MALPSKVDPSPARLSGASKLRCLPKARHLCLIVGLGCPDEGVKETAEQCRAQGAIVRACTVDVGDTGQIATAVADFVR